MKIKELFIKYKDIIAYLFFGMCTTLVNVIIYGICTRLFDLTVMPSTIIAWIFAVVFAYLTNRKWVFHSSATRTKEILKEVVAFFSCRLGTGVVDWVWMLVFVDVLHFNDVIMKFVANIIVIVLNYVTSKLVIFKKEEQ